MNIAEIEEIRDRAVIDPLFAYIADPENHVSRVVISIATDGQKFNKMRVVLPENVALFGAVAKLAAELIALKKLLGRVREELRTTDLGLGLEMGEDGHRPYMQALLDEAKKAAL